MLKVGEKVLYGGAGACTVTKTVWRRCGESQEEREYYVLTPVRDGRTTLYVPVDNAASQAKIRPLLSPEQLTELVRSMPEEEAPWIADEKARQERYKNTLKSGNRRELLVMAKALYLHRKQVKAMGRRLHQTDERLLQEAEKLLCDEFAVVLGMERGQVISYLFEKREEEV